MSRSRHAISLSHAEMYERAVAEAGKLLEFDDTNGLAHSVIAYCFICQGKYKEARDPAECAFRAAPWNLIIVGILAGLLGLTGERERSDELIRDMRGGMLPIGMVIYHSILSEYAAAIDWYERAIEERQPQAALLASAGGFFKPLRSHPRWPKLAKMMNLT